MTDTRDQGIRIDAVGPALRRAEGTPSDRYLASARELFRGVEALTDRKPYALGACVFLAAQTLECCLKAWLWEVRRVQTGAVGEVYGHNLSKLWGDAATSGLELKISTTPPPWCVKLNAGHDNPYHFRYLTKGDTISSPPPAKLTVALRSLIDAVTEAKRARRRNEAAAAIDR